MSSTSRGTSRDDQTLERTRDDEWSIHEIIIHLADSEVGGYWRLRKTLAEKESTLPVYDEEAWARNLSYRIQDRRLALQLFAALRPTWRVNQITHITLDQSPARCILEDAIQHSVKKLDGVRRGPRIELEFVKLLGRTGLPKSPGHKCF